MEFAPLPASPQCQRALRRQESRPRLTNAVVAWRLIKPAHSSHQNTTDGNGESGIGKKYEERLCHRIAHTGVHE
jgi:hypothetical protein